MILVEATPQLIPRTTITGTIPGPVMEMRTMRMRMPGKHSQPSMNLCTTRSKAPRRYPQSMPRMVAMIVAMVVEASPTITEVRAP